MSKHQADSGAIKEHERKSWEEYFRDIMTVVATRSVCLRRRVGAVIVKNRMILSTGYNGPPKGLAHPGEVGCLRDQLGVPSGERTELCRGLHAEQNAIIQAAYHGVSIEGSVIFTTTHPCVTCAKMIINAGIETIYYVEGYPDDLSVSLIEEAGVKRVRLDP